MTEPYEAAATVIFDELDKVLGPGVFDSFSAEVKAAATRAVGELGRATAGLSVSPQRLLEVKATLSNVQVVGTITASTLWDSIGKAAGNVIAPIAKILTGMFGIKLPG